MARQVTSVAFLASLAECRLVASVQTSEGSPLDVPEVLSRLAIASKEQGVTVLRLQGEANIRKVKSDTGLPVIGLIKRSYSDSSVYITATKTEVEEAATAGAEVIALDGTPRQRPGGESLADLIALAHRLGKVVLADIDSTESALFAVGCGADFVSTTLGGYTDQPSPPGPDLGLLRSVVEAVSVPVLAEGRFDQPWQVEAALRIGACGVVIGGSLNDPEKTTRRFMPKPAVTGEVGAVDIGGTWLRFARFSSAWQMLECEKVLNPTNRKDRIAWIRERIEASGVCRLGVSTGGIVDPRTGECWTAKEYLMPDQTGIRFDQSTFSIPTYAHGDGHATAWGHACLPKFAGRRVATLALGTGVGCGFVQNGAIWSGQRGEYPRINDLPTSQGVTYESLLGGLHLSRHPNEEQMETAKLALRDAVFTLRNLYFPDEVVVGGSVGLSGWLQPELDSVGAIESPFGTDAGLYGAAALALFPSYLDC